MELETLEFAKQIEQQIQLWASGLTGDSPYTKNTDLINVINEYLQSKKYDFRHLTGQIFLHIIAQHKKLQDIRGLESKFRESLEEWIKEEKKECQRRQNLRL